jgi:hypothetical protein
MVIQKLIFNGIINPVVSPELALATPLVQSTISKSLKLCRGVLAGTEPLGEAGVQGPSLTMKSAAISKAPTAKATSPANRIHCKKTVSL